MHQHSYITPASIVVYNYLLIDGHDLFNYLHIPEMGLFLIKTTSFIVLSHLFKYVVDVVKNWWINRKNKNH